MYYTLQRLCPIETRKISNLSLLDWGAIHQAGLRVPATRYLVPDLTRHTKYVIIIFVGVSCQDDRGCAFWCR